MMGNLSRRKFFQGAGALTAAAAIGIPIYKDIREYGPVDIRFFFFSDKPHVIKGDLLADDDRDLFRIRAYHAGRLITTAEVKLSDIQKIVSMPRKKIRLGMTIIENEGIKKDHLNGIAEDGKLSFLFGEPGKREDESIPLWLMLEDVKQVL